MHIKKIELHEEYEENVRKIASRNNSLRVSNYEEFKTFQLEASKYTLKSDLDILSTKSEKN